MQDQMHIVKADRGVADGYGAYDFQNGVLGDVVWV